jgi:hypothetical protein
MAWGGYIRFERIDLEISYANAIPLACLSLGESDPRSEIFLFRIGRAEVFRDGTGIQPTCEFMFRDWSPARRPDRRIRVIY